MIAKVARAMAVAPSRKAIVTQAQDSWVIRNISFPYKVGPIDDRPEMFLVQPEAADFVLSPGRCALVIKGQGYDFTVAGRVTDPRGNASSGSTSPTARSIRHVRASELRHTHVFRERRRKP